MITRSLVSAVWVATLFLSGCKNHYNDFIHWADNIPQGTDLQTVSGDQPDYVEIDWEHPICEYSDTCSYRISRIHGNHIDSLNMTHRLVFSSGKYLRRDSKK